MSFHEICAKDFENSVFHTIAKEWMLITAETKMSHLPLFVHKDTPKNLLTRANISPFAFSAEKR